ncbi:hypothetical protein E6R60_36380 [Streptomyces sp. A0642]|uniref:hypothetical protein n=1 Tax=Streptomyces sp. A0642 TaxID=2563100 RepID=UPI0010A271A3|nr:hypothetical protein [Streptomyces sp. A0642]THA60419.1 hypothetical protein E6R60_36380 [Streptomyces sp. A0642]
MKQVRDNVLASVLETHGEHCACRGACGKTHTDADGQCNAMSSGKNKPLMAAPQTPHATDAQNAAVPLDQLRPWCWSCWRAALAAEQVRADEQRSRELAEMQIGLFDVGADAAA